MNKPKRCTQCGKPEKRLAGGFYTTIAPRLGICANCINKALREAK